MPKAKAPNRKRMKFDFRLEYRRVSDVILMEQIRVLKSRHEFLGVIRDGIRLVCDLRDGRFDVLNELFPGVRAAIRAEVIAEMPTVTPSPASEQFEQMMQNIARLEALVMQQGRAQPAALATTTPRASGVTVAEGASGKSSAETVAKNFIASMGTLAAGFFD